MRLKIIGSREIGALLMRVAKIDGLGSGLSLSKSIIEAHGGRFSKGSRLSGAAIHFNL